MTNDIVIDGEPFPWTLSDISLEASGPSSGQGIDDHGAQIFACIVL